MTNAVTPGSSSGRVLSLLECSSVATLKFLIIILNTEPSVFILHWVPQLCSSPGWSPTVGFQMDWFPKQVLLGLSVDRCDSWSRVVPYLACPLKPLGRTLEIWKVYLCEIVSPSVPSLSPPLLSGSNVWECFWLS